MLWLWIAIGTALILLGVAMSRRMERRSPVRGLKAHFPRIARSRLVGNFPELDPLLDQLTLRLLLDWMLCEACRRTNSRDLDDLMRWQTEAGEQATGELIASVTTDAVGRLPKTALRVIDAAQGRAVAAVVIEHSIVEAAARSSPQAEVERV